METMYVVTRQTTSNGTATAVTSVTGRDKDEALLNAKIRGYKTMEAFKNEPTMITAFIGVTNLVGGFILIENWKKEIPEVVE